MREGFGFSKKQADLVKMSGIVFLTGMMALSACGSVQEETKTQSTELASESTENKGDFQETIQTQELETIAQEQMQESLAEGEENTIEVDDILGQVKIPEISEDPLFTPDHVLTWEDLKYHEFLYASGAGAWGDIFTVAADGSFTGEYHDSEMGEEGEEYPYGTVYLCEYTGQFSELKKIDDTTYEFEMTSIQWKNEIDTEKIKEGIRYVYTEPFGLGKNESGSKKMTLYLPRTSKKKLMDVHFMGEYCLYDDSIKEMEYAVINNNSIGFQAIYDGTFDERARQRVYDSVQYEKERRKEAEKDGTTTGYCQCSQEISEDWDYTLNFIWGLLEKDMDQEAFEKLRAEQREWIKEKETKVKEEEKSFKEDGMSVTETMMNSYEIVSDMTKERILALLDYFKK